MNIPKEMLEWKTTESYMVKLHIAHNYISGVFMEQRFHPEWTVEKVKDQVYLRTGTEPAFQVLTLQDASGKTICTLDNDAATLASLGAQDGFTLHCQDTNPNSLAKNGGFEDLSQVEKYEISDEAYEARDNSYRAWKKKLEREEPNHPWLVKIRNMKENKTDEEEAKHIHVGDRVEVLGGRRGTVRFVGVVPEIKSGWWVGIEYDEPSGKHDGVVKGKRYFDAAPMCGGFMRPSAVKVGDFPPLGLDDLEDDDEL
ncbi:CAP-Gly domain [Carpediemonas membranifera]|uniref:CAP-Gly domain n=1 Tax=Carpediemonas membranifera TaxID=201153 RepID=A0A8J6B0T7_9EUKA|nr:Ubiquitin-like domain [Carpediemonas membranifera]KAG9395991.1 CAP-Gly domain [Carpediemonas membranifera]|eukprot:KAG9395985.1 Ubiquitin-like domain [Carpediemonas membranifera]